MAFNQEVIDTMDRAAELADKKIKDIPEEHVKIIANWYKSTNWYKSNFMAGYKRLGKIILKYADK